MNADKQNVWSLRKPLGLTHHRSRGTCKATILLSGVGILTVTVRSSWSVILTGDFVEKTLSLEVV